MTRGSTAYRDAITDRAEIARAARIGTLMRVQGRVWRITAQDPDEETVVHTIVSLDGQSEVAIRTRRIEAIVDAIRGV